MDLKSLLMMMMQDFKKEIQENTGKQLEAFKEERQKFLRELQETTIKQVMELNKIRNHRCEHQQQNTSDGRETLRCRRFHREHGHNNQIKC